PAISTFKQLRYSLLNHPAISQSFCIGLTTVVCETFLMTMPEYMSYQDFIENASNFVEDFPTKRSGNISLWDWQPMVEPFQSVSLPYKLSRQDLSIVASCVDAVYEARHVFRNATMEMGQENIQLTLPSAKYFIIGACRLGELATFKRRADMLWQLCMAGCGDVVNENNTEGVDWTTICDAFLFLTPELRAFYRCRPQNAITETCRVAATYALGWCKGIPHSR
ncbi:hypothetical protein BIW11_06114, partial [Tropilaelaps mercedesae]